MVDARRRVLVCPRCGSHERHRALWLYLAEHLPVLGRRVSLLHWAPEPALARRLLELPEVEYTSADLDPAKAMRKLDITAIDAPDASWDVILCSHVLEHIPDDRRAMSELARVLKPGGRALVLVPVDRERQKTLEDPSITSPEARFEAYWSDDHVRLYGRDFPERLRSAGFSDVAVERPVEGLDAATLLRHGLAAAEEIYVATKFG
jgi:SAM-dependent methyltransferase